MALDSARSLARKLRKRKAGKPRLRKRRPVVRRRKATKKRGTATTTKKTPKKTSPVSTAPRPSSGSGSSGSKGAPVTAVAAVPTQVAAGATVSYLAAPAVAATMDASERERLFLNRFGTGYSQASLQQLRRIGTPHQWLAAQLTPTRFAENPKVAEVDGWFSSLLNDSPAVRWANQSTQRKGGWVYGHEMGNWSILRRIYSERTVLEKLTDFWSTNLHVPMTHDRAWIWRMDYDATIRRHALGRFEDLLTACSLHPAMLFYLDNYRSVRNNPNENQGRELLELHTVGRAAGYTEQMVKDSAKILSGYTVRFDTSAGNYDPFYDATKHTTGAVQVLGFSDANAAADGSQLTRSYLSYLAKHPATAQNLARKMATAFCSDTASDRLVSVMAAAYLAADTSIPAMLTAMAGDAEFLASTGAKVRNPIEDLVATARVLEVVANKAPTTGDGDDSYARHANWTHQSLQAFAWPRPDGPPVKNGPWSTPSRMFGSYQMHWSHVGGWWPKGAAYKPAAYWVVQDGISFDDYVDYVARRLLGRPADDRMRRAARSAVSGAAWFRTDQPISGKGTTNGLYGWLGVRVVATLLDSPDHMLT